MAVYETNAAVCNLTPRSNSLPSVEFYILQALHATFSVSCDYKHVKLQ